MAQTFNLFPGIDGAIVARKWDLPDPRYVVLLCHGYGEHMGRYDHVAARFNADGAAVYGQDHRGHGLSGGERVLMTDAESLVEDFHALSDVVRREYPDVPLVLVGHSMGGMLAARYVQKHGDELVCAVLSAPVISGGLVPRPCCPSTSSRPIPSTPRHSPGIPPSARLTWPTRWCTTAAGSAARWRRGTG
jgi:Lysophospholipase